MFLRLEEMTREFVGTSHSKAYPKTPCETRWDMRDIISHSQVIFECLHTQKHVHAIRLRRKDECMMQFYCKYWESTRHFCYSRFTNASKHKCCKRSTINFVCMQLYEWQYGVWRTLLVLSIERVVEKWPEIGNDWAKWLHKESIQQ